MEMKNVGVEQGGAVLCRIIGARLTSVNFVLDYLILGFDERGTLTSLVWPEIISITGSVMTFGMSGYRDRLCDLITHAVSEVHFSEEETITISFGNNRLRILLRQRQVPGERAIFTAPKHFLYVW